MCVCVCVFSLFFLFLFFDFLLFIFRFSFFLHFSFLLQAAKRKTLVFFVGFPLFFVRKKKTHTHTRAGGSEYTRWSRCDTTPYRAILFRDVSTLPEWCYTPLVEAGARHFRGEHPTLLLLVLQNAAQ